MPALAQQLVYPTGESLSQADKLCLVPSLIEGRDLIQLLKPYRERQVTCTRLELILLICFIHKYVMVETFNLSDFLNN